MIQVGMKYNPYRLETNITVNGLPIAADSALYKVTKGKRLQEWIGDFPKMLREDFGALRFSVEFHGMPLDWDDVEEAFVQAEREGIVNKCELKLVEVRSDTDVRKRIEDVFHDLQEGPIDDFRDARLQRAFDEINQAEFPINVIATMSSGKSTLVNALLGEKLMPSKNGACTATITEILDTDADSFTATVYDKNGEILRDDRERDETGRPLLLERVPLSYDLMVRLNDRKDAYQISAEGNIPFLDSRTMSLKLVDTPGPNSAQNQEHKNTTYRAINSKSNNLILYVMNGTQLDTNDDANLLEYVAEQIQKGGKQIRDRFLFVINKMDEYNPEEEDIQEPVDKAKKALARYGIYDPQIFPCSAFTALNIRTLLKNVDIDDLTTAERRALPKAAKDALGMIDSFVTYPPMWLEQYSTLSPSAKQGLEVRLRKAEENGDTKEQALIHCGVCSIEAAITAYVTKYARTKKIKDLVESFYEVLESNQVLAKAKTQIATDKEAAEACARRAKAIQAKIANGEEATAFKERIAALDPVPDIEKSAEKLKGKAQQKVTRAFDRYGDEIKSREEAKRLVMEFSQTASDELAELTASLENTINDKIIKTGNRLLQEYEEKLTRVDDSISGGELDFQTVDLIRGALSIMRETAENWTSDSFAADVVDEIGEETTEIQEYREWVGQKAEKRVVGYHQEKIGTKKVKVGEKSVKVGVRKVRNSKKRGFFGFLKFWEPKYVDEDVYGKEAIYKDEDVYEVVADYETFMVDNVEKRTREIKHFSISTADVRTALSSPFDRTLYEGIEDALKYAKEQVESIKAHFSTLFDELDGIITEKYRELERYAADEKESRARLQKNTEILQWIEDNMREINEILDL